MTIRTILQTSLTVLILSPLATTPVLAQKGGFEIGAGAGLVKLDDKLGGETNLSLDVRAGVFLSHRFELEVEASRASAIVGGTFSAYTLNAVFHFPGDGDFVPYVLVGAGIANVEQDGLFAEPTDDDGTAVRAAVGGRFWLGTQQRASIRAELSALSEDAFDDDSIHAGVTAIFCWRFGG